MPRTIATVTEFDETIQGAVAIQFPLLDWRAMKAQLWQESSLKPLAESPAGAMGIAQFMLPTWRDVCAQLGWSLNTPRTDPARSITASAYYMGQLFRSWAVAEDRMERYKLALASYNGGIGNIRKAARLACGVRAALTWDAVAAALPNITGRHAAETTSYVPAILRHFETLAGPDAAPVSAAIK